MKWLAVLCLVLGLLLIAVLFHFDQKVHQPIKLNDPAIYQVKAGQSAKGILNQLKQQGVLTDNIGLKIRLKLEPELAKIKIGTYQMLPTMSGLELLELFASGKEMQFSISLVEGLRWQDWLLELKSHPQVIVSNNFQQQLDALKSGLPEQSIEGYLLPDTYYFVAQTPAIEIVKRAHQNMQTYLQDAWLNRAVDLPYDDPYHALIMASIIEKETGIALERPRISGVFVNRLNLNMRLQTDPTVIYGMGENFDGNIRRKDLRQPTAYNTYVIKGLPPTPIAMPSKLAVDAAMHPLPTDELYFVSKGDGSHQFSVTLSEHNLAVRQYQLNK
jgi:UPF0755 protein